MSALTIAAGLCLLVAFWANLDASRKTKRLRHLRANCFLTDERGVRVRYAAASEAVRARAEGQ